MLWGIMFILLRQTPAAKPAGEDGGKTGAARFLTMIITLALSAAILILGACGGQVASGGKAQAGAFDKYLRANNLILPQTIRYNDFDDACRRRGLLKSTEYLTSIGITIHGNGDDRYISGNDLLKACGEQCTPAEGLGDLLSDLTTYNITNR